MWTLQESVLLLEFHKIYCLWGINTKFFGACLTAECHVCVWPCELLFVVLHTWMRAQVNASSKLRWHLQLWMKWFHVLVGVDPWGGLPEHLIETPPIKASRHRLCVIWQMHTRITWKWLCDKFPLVLLAGFYPFWMRIDIQINILYFLMILYISLMTHHTLLEIIFYDLHSSLICSSSCKHSSVFCNSQVS